MGSSAGGEEGDPGVKKDGRDVGTWEAVVVAAACSVGGADERRWWVPTAKFPSLNSQCRPVGKARGSFCARFSALPSQQSHGWRFGEGFTSTSDFRFLSGFHQTWTGLLACLLLLLPYKK